MGSSGIVVKDLKKHYGAVKAVDGISFEVEEGSVFGMLGPNGAGKTTTIETIVGLNKKDSGQVSVFGYDNENDLDKVKKLIGVQLQSPSLFPRLTVKEIIELFGSFYPDPLSSTEVIEKIGLEEKADTHVKNLSGGQKHRLAVGLAMVSNGKVVFLDEPTTGLDPQARRQVWDVILALKGAGKTVFITTHYMDEAEKLCDKLLVIDQGKIIAEGSPRSLIRDNFKETAVEFKNPGFADFEIEELLEQDIAERYSIESEEDHIILYTDDVPETIKGLMDFAESKDKTIDDIMVRHATLEDVFLKLTGRGIRE
ncbi:MAG: ABC transporter ATP-binding protein [Halanaerobiales bacterium]